MPMRLSNLLKSAAGTCPLCRQKTGILSREHPECRRTFQAGWNEMVRLAWDAARSHEFHPNSLRVSLAEIARDSYGDASTVARALEEGWRKAVKHAAADGSITHEEEFRLRRFRDRLGLNRSRVHAQATAQLNRTFRQRLTRLTQAAATTVEDGDRLLKRLSEALRKAPSDRTTSTGGRAARNLFLACEPLAGWRQVAVTERRTMQDFAHQMRWLVDETYSEVEVVRVVLDNLNTHRTASLYETFPAAEARRIAKRLEFHYTPKHGSWLNMAEIAFSVLSRCFRQQRVPDELALRREVQALVTERNVARATINWRFSIQDARTILHRLYPFDS